MQDFNKSFDDFWRQAFTWLAENKKLWASRQASTASIGSTARNVDGSQAQGSAEGGRNTYTDPGRGQGQCALVARLRARSVRSWLALNFFRDEGVGKLHLSQIALQHLAERTAG